MSIRSLATTQASHFSLAIHHDNTGNVLMPWLTTVKAHTVVVAVGVISRLQADQILGESVSLISRKLAGFHLGLNLFSREHLFLLYRLYQTT
jgi:hypothetical protein